MLAAPITFLSSGVAGAQTPAARQCSLVPHSARPTRHHPALLVRAALHELGGVVVGEVELVLHQVLVRARVPASNATKLA